MDQLRACFRFGKEKVLQNHIAGACFAGTSWRQHDDFSLDLSIDEYVQTRVQQVNLKRADKSRAEANSGKLLEKTVWCPGSWSLQATLPEGVDLEQVVGLKVKNRVTQELICDHGNPRPRSLDELHVPLSQPTDLELCPRSTGLAASVASTLKKFASYEGPLPPLLGQLAMAILSHPPPP